MNVKICGLQTLEDVKCVNATKPDYAGFILSESKRRIDVSTAVELKKHLSKDILAVGVFVNEPTSFIIEAINRGAIDIVQLHGSESQECIDEIKNKTNVPIIKAIPVRTREDILLGDRLECDFLLLDTYSKSVAGGCGKVFDWSLIPGKLRHPYFLAGGLCLGNVELALKTGAFAVDVSSGVETDGVKDDRKISEFVHYIKGKDLKQ